MKFGVHMTPLKCFCHLLTSMPGRRGRNGMLERSLFHSRIELIFISLAPHIGGGGSKVFKPRTVIITKATTGVCLTWQSNKNMVATINHHYFWKLKWREQNHRFNRRLRDITQTIKPRNVSTKIYTKPRKRGYFAVNLAQVNTLKIIIKIIIKTYPQNCRSQYNPTN